MQKRRRTKIIATLGPSTSSEAQLLEILDAGVDLIRVNFSHGDSNDHRELIQRVRACAKKQLKEIGIIADLQGPKIRIRRFKNSPVTLKPGDNFTLDTAWADAQGDETIVGVTYPYLPQDVSPGDVLLLDDGLIELQVDSIEGTKVHCQVTVGGSLKNNKGINRRGGGLSAGALTDKDRADLITAVECEVDYIAVSFVASAADVLEAKQRINDAGGYQAVIAKIERAEALDSIDDIIRAADGVMVARGDLAIEIGQVEVPGVQKRLIDRARSLDRPVITATQMMESMVKNPIPTRAEVSDVANAVLDGTDAVMLSAETAVGDHPSKVIRMMSEICVASERHPNQRHAKARLDREFQRIDESIAMATMYVANHLPIQGIVALTESGSTPLWMSRISSGIPIYGLSRHLKTQRRITLYRGVYPVNFDPTRFDRKDVNSAAVKECVSLGILRSNDRVIITKGNFMGRAAGTNAMRIVNVNDVDEG